MFFAVGIYLAGLVSALAINYCLNAINPRDDVWTSWEEIDESNFDG